MILRETNKQDIISTSSKLKRRHQLGGRKGVRTLSVGSAQQPFNLNCKRFPTPFSLPSFFEGVHGVAAWIRVLNYSPSVLSKGPRRKGCPALGSGEENQLLLLFAVS